MNQEQFKKDVLAAVGESKLRIDGINDAIDELNGVDSVVSVILQETLKAEQTKLKALKLTLKMLEPSIDMVREISNNDDERQKQYKVGCVKRKNVLAYNRLLAQALKEIGMSEDTPDIEEEA